MRSPWGLASTPVPREPKELTMPTYEYTQTSTMWTTNCIKCGSTYAILESVKAHHVRVGGNHYCPYCGTSQGWKGRPEEERRAEEIANLKAEISRKEEQVRRARQDAEHFEASRNAYKGQVTRLKNRAKNGVCPCCNRHFENLQRHMASKHPSFTEEPQP